MKVIVDKRLFESWLTQLKQVQTLEVDKPKLESVIKSMADVKEDNDNPYGNIC